MGKSNREDSFATVKAEELEVGRQMARRVGCALLGLATDPNLEKLEVVLMHDVDVKMNAVEWLTNPDPNKTRVNSVGDMWKVEVSFRRKVTGNGHAKGKGTAPGVIQTS